MFQIYKKREFSDYINDTFIFFKVYGKHFFKNYFIINGSFLLLSSALLYFVFKVYFEFMFSSFSGTIGNQTNSISSLFGNNTGLIAAVGIFGFFLLMIVSILQYAYPLLYLNLIDKNKGQNFTASDIIKDLKSKFPRLLIFVVGMLFILFPLVLIIIVLNVLLCFIIIGFPLLFITIPGVLCFIHLTFYHYITGNTGFFNSIGNAISDLKNQFWAIVMSTFIVFLLMYIVSMIFSLIPYLFGMASIFSTPTNYEDNSNPYSSISIIMIIVMIISFLVSFILNNLLLINQGLIYYSQREYNDNVSASDTIDMIGIDGE